MPVDTKKNASLDIQGNPSSSKIDQKCPALTCSHSSLSDHIEILGVSLAMASACLFFHSVNVCIDFVRQPFRNIEN